MYPLVEISYGPRIFIQVPMSEFFFPVLMLFLFFIFIFLLLCSVRLYVVRHQFWCSAEKAFETRPSRCIQCTHCVILQSESLEKPAQASFTQDTERARSPILHRVRRTRGLRVDLGGVSFPTFVIVTNGTCFIRVSGNSAWGFCRSHGACLTGFWKENKCGMRLEHMLSTSVSAGLPDVSTVSFYWGRWHRDALLSFICELGFQI